MLYVIETEKQIKVQAFIDNDLKVVAIYSTSKAKVLIVNYKSITIVDSEDRILFITSTVNGCYIDNRKENSTSNNCG